MLCQATTPPARRVAASTFLLAACLALSGCFLIPSASNPALVPILSETPAPSQIVVQPGETPPRACVISVCTPPPDPQAETPPRRPGPDFVWMPGSWRYYHRGYVWAPGSWARPPQPRATYTPAQWTQVNGNSMFTEGYWHF